MYWSCICFHLHIESLRTVGKSSIRSVIRKSWSWSLGEGEVLDHVCKDQEVLHPRQRLSYTPSLANTKRNISFIRFEFSINYKSLRSSGNVLKIVIIGTFIPFDFKRCGVGFLDDNLNDSSWILLDLSNIADPCGQSRCLSCRLRP